MKIYIIFEFKKGAWGGGNQFLKALRNELVKLGLYTEDPDEANIFLFNSFHDVSKVLRFKRRYPNKLFIHRVDGPTSLIRGTKNNPVGYLVYLMNESIADGTIFQSKFSLQANKDIGMKSNFFETIIINAPDNNIFYKKNGVSNQDLSQRKVRLISTSWSPNILKGFREYKYLDNNLDFSRFEYVFVGNTPVKFKNIKVIKALDSASLANKLREADIYITASHNDPCSNSLIEALSSGLPALFLNDGGHPEIVGSGGVMFEGFYDIIDSLQEIAKNYENYVEKIPKFDIKIVAKDYCDFIQSISNKKTQGVYEPKKIGKLKAVIFTAVSFLVTRI